MPPPLRLLQQEAADLGVTLSPEAWNQTLRYLELLASWNATTSLIQARDWQDLARRHLAEGWLAARLLPASRSLRLLDIGSGGGIPAVPLRIAHPDMELTLVEPRQRKAAFLQAVARHLGAPWPDVRCSRLEDLDERERWDVVSFRGIKLAPAVVAARVAEGGRVLRFPGRPDDARDAWSAAGWRRAASIALPTPGLHAEAWERAGD